MKLCGPALRCYVGSSVQRSVKEGSVEGKNCRGRRLKGIFRSEIDFAFEGGGVG